MLNKTEFNINKKELLDSLLEKNQTTIVGEGYIDIIVPRSHLVQLINDLVENNITITHVTWWEFCKWDDQNHYWMWWPKNYFGDGWYSELPIDYFQIIKSTDNKVEIKSYLIALIQNKEISFWEEIIRYKNCEWLTPAIWLDLPDDWKNIQIN